ncbi:MAG TPA: hypothetical protein PLL37_11865, partial [Bacillota bacterium]|nr:hypothetical protein [Bacillota bacterium]
MEKMYAEVIVSNKCKETDRTYSYLVPENMKESIRVGSRVIVPFGVGNKQIEGYVVGLKGSIDFKPSKIKSVARLLDEKPVMSPKLVELAKWMKEKYLCYFIDAIQAIVPSPVRTKSSYSIELCVCEQNLEKLEKLNSNFIMEIVEFLEENSGVAKLEDIREYFSDRKIDYYIKKLIEAEVVKKVQIIGSKIGEKRQKHLYLSEDKNIQIKKTASKQREVYELLLKCPGISLAKLKEACGDCDSAVKAMEKKGYVRIEETDEYRQVCSKTYAEKRHELTQEQNKALSDI